MYRCWIIICLGIFVRKGTATVQGENCGTVDIMKCLPASEQRFFFPDTSHKLRDYCDHLMSGLDCAKRIIDSCATEADKDIYYNLTQDMFGMNVALCTPGSDLSVRFLKHVDCYKTLSERFRTCSDRYISNIVVVKSLSQDEQIKMTCCTVHEYERCMRNSVEGRCDADAQKLVGDTVVNVLKQTFKFCQQFDDVPKMQCYQKFSASQGHATSSLNEESEEFSGAQMTFNSSKLLFLILVFLVAYS
ncbi:uncharacterized protein LOC129220294 [Uloborus diversus]|uniref:uncharacterized protein LOC129220294 n=1 Tax=Uloborus diversus TaxID=327109 RepID=UPI002409EDAE|nr:uncharacterized protein LOC129220294 [Uloborus diversus]